MIATKHKFLLTNSFNIYEYKRLLFNAINASVAEECDGEGLVALNFADGSRLALPVNGSPPCPIDSVEFIYDIDDVDVPLVCHLDYEPECLGHGDHPDYPSTMCLVAAYIKDTDILGFLSPDKIEAIELLALDEQERFDGDGGYDDE